MSQSVPRHLFVRYAWAALTAFAAAAFFPWFLIEFGNRQWFVPVLAIAAFVAFVAIGLKHVRQLLALLGWVRFGVAVLVPIERAQRVDGFIRGSILGAVGIGCLLRGDLETQLIGLWSLVTGTSMAHWAYCGRDAQVLTLSANAAANIAQNEAVTSNSAAGSPS